MSETVSKVLPTASAVSVARGARLKQIMGQGLALRLGQGFVVGVGTRVLLLAMHIVVGRQLGLNGYGTFALMVGMVSLLATLGSVGWNQVITRFVAQYHVEKQWGLLHGIIIRGDQIVLRITATLGVLISLGAWLLFPGAVVSNSLVVAGLCLPVVAMRQYRSKQLLGIHRTKTAMLLESGAVPGLVVVTVLVLGVDSAAGAVLVYTLMSAVVTVAMTVMLYRRLPTEVFRSQPEFLTREWQSAATPAILGQSSSILMRRVDLLMIGPLLGVSAVGLYSSAFRISFALQCIPIVIGMIVQPMFASAWYDGRIGEVKRVFTGSLLASIGIAIPVAAVLLIFPEQVMSVFGKEFRGGTSLLMVFIAGQVINAMTGPVAPLLVMTGHERIFGISTGVVAVYNIVGNLIAIPLFGVMGAAVVTASSIVLLNLWQFNAAWKQLRQPVSDP